MNPFRNKNVRRWTFWVVGLSVALVGGYYGLKKVARPYVKQWRQDRFNTTAREFLAKEDALNAILMARKSLESSRENPEAWRIAAAASKKLDRVDALFYQDNLCRIERNKENFLELIRLAVKFGRDAFAIEAVTRAGEFAVNDPEYYELAARAYLRVGKPLGAKYFLDSLTKLRPTDKVAQLDLAEIEMSEDKERKDVALRARVRAMIDDPEVRSRALTLLLNESVAAKLKVETQELATRLRSEPGLTVEQRMLLILAYRLVQPDQVAPALNALQAEVGERSLDVARTIDFMVRLDLAGQVGAWEVRLNEKVRSEEQVRRANADALFSLKEWDKMRSVLLGGTWTNLEFLRRALLAYSYRAQNRVAEFDEAWRGAVIEAGANLRSCVLLMGRLTAWGWEPEQYDLLWKIFSLVPGEPKVRERLLMVERQRGNTANLNRLFARIAEVDPNDKGNLNNFAYTSLLLNANLTRASLITEELVKAEPENPYFITNRALALFKQEKYEDALKLLETLRASALIQPERILLHALFLSKTGDHERAAERLSVVPLSALLPEERNLAQVVEEDLSRQNRSLSTVSRLRQLQREQGAGSNSEGWLGLVAGSVRAKASIDMQLSDTLYSNLEYDGMIDVLKAAQWQEFDHLRQALLAFARRKVGDSGGSLDAWRQSVRLAQRNSSQLEDLLSLVSKWQWPTERLEVLNRLHANDPKVKARLDELVSHYRVQRRTPDLIRVLKPWVDGVTGSTPEVVNYIYFCLLSDVDVPQATVRAQQVVAARPDDSDARLVQALSLWKQKRYAEAQVQLRGIETSSSGVIPVALVRLAVAVDLGNLDEARTLVQKIDRNSALPEELELVRRLSVRLPAGS